MKNRIGSILLLSVMISCGKERESIKPTSGQITESVYATGRIKADEQFALYASVTGILKQIEVTAGDTVAIGDTLFVIDNLASQLNSESALATLELTRENNKSGSDRLHEMELAVNQASEKYKLDSSLFVRQKKLWDQGIGSQLEFEQRELNFKNSKLNFESAESRFRQVKSQLRTDLRKAELGYGISKKGANDFILRSELAGRIFDVSVDKNALVTPQTVLAIIGRSNSYLIEFQVDEYDISKIQIGQRIIVSMDSHQGELFDASVLRINPIMNERTRTFTVEAKFNKNPSNLYPNLSAEGNIILNIKSHALTIPRKFLEDGKYVYVDKDIRTEVRVGLGDYQKVEIIEGLDSSQIIFLPPVK